MNLNKLSNENASKVQKLSNDHHLADDREIFENTENHEPLEHNKDPIPAITIPKIVEQPPTPSTEDIPPPLSLIHI